MGKFIGYTVGLVCKSGRGNSPIKVEYSEAGADQVKLTAVSGNTLARVGGVRQVTISRAEYEGRPSDNIEQAIWALGAVGLTTGGLTANA